MTTLLIILVVILSVAWLGGFVYLATGLGKWFYHDKLEWHEPADEQSFDGCSYHAVCKYCGKKIMQDSQGNWF